MRLLLDTSVVLGPPVEFDAGEVALSTVTLAEIHFGVMVSRTAETRALRLRQLARVERSFDALPVDEEVAEAYGRVAAAVSALGRNPRSRTADLLIAATAAVHDAELWTRNAADLGGLDDIVRIHPVP